VQENSIHLRRPQWKDMRFIRCMWGDEETMCSVGGPISMTDEQAKEWFARKVDPGNPSDCYRLIIDQKGYPVGEVSYRQLDPDSMTAAFNIKIMHAERDRGYARAAMREFLDEFFNQRGGMVMVDDLALGNVAAQETLLRFGFEHDPDAIDVFRVRLTRERFNALHR